VQLSGCKYKCNYLVAQNLFINFFLKEKMLRNTMEKDAASSFNYVACLPPACRQTG
jgi:hypothetical protein